MTTKLRPADLLGSVSSGTMRPEDLVPAFVDVCNRLRLSRDDRAKVRAIERRMSEDGFYDGEDGECDLTEDLFDILNTAAPPFVYFGAHEGDCADYGFWISWDSIRDAVHDGEIWEDKGNGETMPKLAHYRMVTSDHGNASLYYRNGRVVWEIV